MWLNLPPIAAICWRVREKPLRPICGPNFDHAAVPRCLTSPISVMLLQGNAYV